ncbi:hypothetical protein [Thetidibacter halocola]|uniref:Tail fiber protein n=1 Tax=Thetidibacter halocola TaxID=2827239 RepID=A0A8J7WEK0_9RHOB|nr:hypothetical protein [Thetidibacter halocola]MBS0124934.1 hypothetical protein [Thetidibacter halocola]
MGYINVEGAMIARTASGEQIARARRYVYHQGTDVLARLYTDVGLTDLLANPTIADETGTFEPCYTVDGLYRIVIETPKGERVAVFDNIDVRSAEVAAAASASAAATAALSAQRWAAETEDSIVADGLHSALHYAAKAAASQVAAGSSQSATEVARTAAETAHTGAAAARVAAETAQASAEGARTVAEAARTASLAAQTVAEVAGSGAQAARTQAELAAIAAGAPIHASTAAGLAATSNGDVFLVSTAPGIQVRQNVSGTASVLGWLGEVLYDNAASVIASTETGFATGAIIRTREGAFAYKVAAANATTHHLTTAGGVKLHVLPGPDGYANILAFGATGVAGQNQNAALVAAAASGLPIVLPATGGRYEFSSTLQLTAPWRGLYTAWSSQTVNPGAELKFTGTGTAIVTGLSLECLELTADTTVAGQSGIRIENSVFGVKYHDITLRDFDGTSFAVGLKNSRASFYTDFNGIHIRNDNRDGAVGLYVSGLGLPNSNANTFTNVFITGRLVDFFHIEGNSNKFINVNATPRLDAMTTLTFSSLFKIEGHLNSFDTVYVEPFGSVYPTRVWQFTTGSGGLGANSNKFQNVYLASIGGNGNPYALVEDVGTNNDVQIRPISFNFPQGAGTPKGQGNLIFNAGFRAIDVAGMPKGWQKSGTGTVTRLTSPARGDAYVMSLDVVNSAVTLQQVLVTTANPVTFNCLGTYPPAKFEGQTITVGVWCLSSVAGMGSIAANAGGPTVGSMRHTGSGKWEFLTVQLRGAPVMTTLQVQLRTHFQNAAQTGTVHFSEPVLVMGEDVPRSPEPRPLNDAEAVLAGRIVNNPIVTFPDGNATPSIMDGNVFMTGNTAATTITNFTGRHVGGGAQDIRIFVNDSNTTLANNSNIRTTTNASKVLVRNTVCSLLWNGSRWIEY